MKINEINAKTIITHSKLPDADFVINPYTGCQHACIYCYAEFMKKYTNHTEDWGEFIDIKVNSPDLINPSGKYDNKRILISSVTDPYNPIEKKYETTRRILENLKDFNSEIEILTKSHLVLRDIDILKQIKDIRIGFSISTLNDEFSRKIEPRASLPNQRIQALKNLKENGFRTYLFLSPIFPHITQVKEIIENSYKYVDYLMFENLNVRKNNRDRVYNFVKNNDPELFELYQDIFETKQRPHPYWQALTNEITKICSEKKIECRIYFQHAGLK